MLNQTRQMVLLFVMVVVTVGNFMGRHVVLYRYCNSFTEDKREILAAEKSGFIVFKNRTKIQSEDFVVPRYSAYPFFRELEEDINILGATLINSYYKQNFVLDLKNWVYELKDLTFETWDRLENLPEQGPFILKGSVNSRKSDFNNLMYAQDKKRAAEIYSALCKDGLISQQEIYIRKYVPLKTYLIGLNGLPITEEYRFFVYNKTILSGDYYWASHIEEVTDAGYYPDVTSVPQEFLQKVIDIIDNKINFYVLDVAKTADDSWIVVELNLGEQSGLSQNDPEIFYSNLKKAIELNERTKS